MNKQIKSIEVVTYPDGRMDTFNTSKYSGLSNKTLAMMRCSGNGPKFMKRGRIFYFQSDIDDWMNANGRMTSTAQAKPDQIQKNKKSDNRDELAALAMSAIAGGWSELDHKDTCMEIARLSYRIADAMIAFKDSPDSHE